MERREFLGCMAATATLPVVGFDLLKQDEPERDPSLMSFPIMMVDCANENGLVYPRDVVEKALCEFNAYEDNLATLGYIDKPIGTVELDKVVAKVLKVELVHDIVWADIQWMETPSRLAMLPIDNQFVLRPCGVGSTLSTLFEYELTPHYTVASYSLCYLAFLRKTEATTLKAI